MFVLAQSNRRYLGWLLALATFLTMVTNSTRIHFISMEDYRGPDRGFEVTLTDLIFLAVFPLVASKRGVKWFPYNSLPLLGYGLCCFIATLKAPVPIYAWFTFYKLLKLYFVYWVAANSFRAGLTMEHMAHAYLGIGTWMTFLALKQKYLFGMYRIKGPFDHSNTIPMYVILVLPVLYLWASCNPRLPRWKSLWGIFASLGLMFAVLATQSRAGLVLCGLSLLMVVGLSNLRFPSRRVRLLTLAIMTLAFLGGLKALGTIINRFETAPEESEMARTEFNIAADLMAKDNFFGVGLNSFSYVLTTEERYNGHIKVMANEEQAGVAHHIYRLTAAEMGYPGLVFFVLVWAGFWIRPLWVGRQGRGLPATLLLGFPIGFQALYLIGFLEWAFRLTPVIYLYTIQAGVASALADEVASGAPRLRKSLSKERSLAGSPNKTASP